MRALAAVVAGFLTVSGAAADSLFASPGLGMPTVNLPRMAPLPKTNAIPQFDANQCQLAAGSCPTGRLRRSGNICFCAGSDGSVRQGTTRVKPQDARPSVSPEP